MTRSDRNLVPFVFSVFILLWLGFLFHRSPMFAGSLAGGVLGLTGATFMLIPLTYSCVKRSSLARHVFSQYGSVASLLKAHYYFGLAGALLAVLHTGHKFQSVLGVALTASLLLSVITGFIGQYYLRFVADDIRLKKTQLSQLWRSLDEQYWAYAARKEVHEPGIKTAADDLAPVAVAAADLQFSVQFQEQVRKLFKVWLVAHIVTSIAFYLLLALHVVSSIYFGLRWFQ